MSTHRTMRRTGILLAVVAAGAGAVTGAGLAGGGAASAVTPGTVTVPSTTTTPPATPEPPVTTPRPGRTSPSARPPAPPSPPPLWSEDDRGDDVRELEARLAQLELLDRVRVDGTYGTSTTKAVRAYQKRADIEVTGSVDQATWTALKADTRRPTKAELYPPAPKPSPTSVKLDERCLTGRVICIDKSTRRLAWVVDGNVVDTMSARFGGVSTPTREGTFTVYRKSRDHVSNEYGSEMPYAMFFSGGQAVHYSSDFAARGYDGASHGCVNVRDRGAIRALFDQVEIGDRVVVHRS
jgi:lipoprotein-anchoring transpeptidase ErfK/SrfK